MWTLCILTGIHESTRALADHCLRLGLPMSLTLGPCCPQAGVTEQLCAARDACVTDMLRQCKDCLDTGSLLATVSVQLRLILNVDPTALTVLGLRIHVPALHI